MSATHSSGVVRIFRLTNEPGRLGLSCTPAGVSLAGVPLFRSTQAGFVPRPTSEIATLLNAAKAGRHGVRDHLLILAMFRHGLRVSEAISLRRDEIDLDHARLWIRRLKNGLAVEHPIAGDELRAIKRYLATRKDSLPWLFVSEREQPLALLAAPGPEFYALHCAHPDDGRRWVSLRSTHPTGSAS